MFKPKSKEHEKIRSEFRVFVLVTFFIKLNHKEVTNQQFGKVENHLGELHGVCLRPNKVQSLF